MDFFMGITASILATLMLTGFLKYLKRNKEISFNYNYNLKVFRALVDVCFNIFQFIIATLNVWLLEFLYKIGGNIDALISIAPIISFLFIIIINIIAHIVTMFFAKKRFKFIFINDMEYCENNKKLHKKIYTKCGIVFKGIFTLLINLFFIINAILNKSIPIVNISKTKNINIHISFLLMALFIFLINCLRYLYISDENVGVYRINSNKYNRKLLVHINDDKDIEINTYTNVIIDEHNNILINDKWYDKKILLT